MDKTFLKQLNSQLASSARTSLKTNFLLLPC